MLADEIAEALRHLTAAVERLTEMTAEIHAMLRRGR